MATEYQFVDDSGITRLDGFLVPDPGTLLSSSVALSSAQILALDTTPVTVVAGIPGFVIAPIQGVVVTIEGTVSYTNNYNLRYFVGPTFAGAGWGGAVLVQPFNTSGEPTAMMADILNALKQDSEPFSLLDGQPLRIDTSANVTDGDGTASVFTVYTLVPLA